VRASERASECAYLGNMKRMCAPQLETRRTPLLLLLSRRTQFCRRLKSRFSPATFVCEEEGEGEASERVFVIAIDSGCKVKVREEEEREVTDVEGASQILSS